MSVITLKDRNGAPLYQGSHASVRAALETAIRKKYPLRGVSLRGANLMNAELDESCLPDADFTGANLCGANISEALLDGAEFSQALLCNACLCESQLTGCRFLDTIFGATDIAGCDLTNSQFSGPSALFLNFRDTSSLRGVLYYDPEGRPCPMTRPPLVLMGLSHPVALFDRHLRHRGLTISCEERTVSETYLY